MPRGLELRLVKIKFLDFSLIIHTSKLSTYSNGNIIFTILHHVNFEAFKINFLLYIIRSYLSHFDHSF